MITQCKNISNVKEYHITLQFYYTRKFNYIYFKGLLWVQNDRNHLKDGLLNFKRYNNYIPTYLANLHRGNKHTGNYCYIYSTFLQIGLTYWTVDHWSKSFYLTVSSYMSSYATPVIFPHTSKTLDTPIWDYAYFPTSELSYCFCWPYKYLWPTINFFSKFINL